MGVRGPASSVEVNAVALFDKAFSLMGIHLMFFISRVTHYVQYWLNVQLCNLDIIIDN